MNVLPVWLERRRQDLRVGLRGLRRRPSLALAAVAVLGLGVGMSTAMYTVYRAVLVERLPVIDAQRGNFFEVLGVRPVVGRLLRQDDDANGDFGRSPNATAPEPLVLSHRAWIQWFGGPPAS